jgi:SAM-dependent methyltransferase
MRAQGDIEISFLAEAERSYSKMIDLRQLNRSVSWKLDIAAKQKKLANALLQERLELKACPICQSKEFHLFVEVFHYSYCECASCGHIFSHRPPRPEAIKRLYSTTEKSRKSIQAEVYIDKDMFSKRVEIIANPKVQYVAERCSKGKWVDIGCGVGEIVVAAKNHGWEAIGVESDPEESAFANMMGANVKNVFITEDNVTQYVKDAIVVSLFNILEHLIAPDDFLGAIADAVPSGTHIVIEVPRHPSCSSLANLCFPDMASRHICPPDHLHIFTEKSIGLVLERNNLVAEHVWLFGQDFYEIVSSILAAKGNCDESLVLLEQIFRAASDIQRAIDYCQLSDTMIIICMKK